MKGLNIKKLAAVATGAALVGTALAPVVSAINITNSDVYNTNGTPAVDIVVGTAAQVSDVVWAGNIAAKVAEKAGTTGTCTATPTGSCSGDAVCEVSDLSVALSVGGTTTYENAKTYKTIDLNSAVPQTDANKEYFGKILTDAQLPHMVNKSITIKWNGTNYTRTFKEKIGITADARMDVARSSVQDLVAYMENAGDFNYTIDLGTGIPIHETSSATSALFTDGTNDNIKIPFFGQDYLVSAVGAGMDDINGHYIKLMKSSEKETYNEGDIITGLTGKGAYEGQDMTVKVVQVIQTGAATTTYQGTFELYDAEGTLVDTRTVASAVYLNEEFVDADDEYALSSILYVDTVAVASTTNVGYVDVMKGTSVVELYHNKIYPYDSSFTGSPPWKAYITSGSTYVTEISIINGAKLWDDTNPIYAQYGSLTEAGQSGSYEATLIEGEAEGTDGLGYAKVLFEGFEQDESMTTITIGEKETIALTSVSTIKYKDTDDTSHTIPLWIKLTGAQSGSGGSEFEFDGQTIWYAVNKGTDDADSSGKTATVDVNITDGSTINGIALKTTDANSADVNMGINNDLNMYILPTDGTDMIMDINGVATTVIDINVSDSNAYRVLQFDGNIMFRKKTSTGDIFAPGSSVNNTTVQVAGAESHLTSTWYYDDRNADGVAGVAMFQNPVWLEGANEKYYKYALMVSESANKVYLLLDASTNFDVQYNKDIAMIGTDRIEGGFVDNDNIAQPLPFPDINHTVVDGVTSYPPPIGSGDNDANAMPYFYPDDAEFDNSKSDSSDNDFVIATLSIETDDEDGVKYDANLYIDTRLSEGKAIALPNTNLSTYTSDVNMYDPDTSTGTPSNVRINLDENPLSTTQPSKAYNDFGAKFSLSDGVLTVAIPENRPKPVLVVKSTMTTTTTDAGEELTIAKGASGTTSSGSTITISDVTYTAACSDTGGGEVTCTASPSSYSTQAAVGQLVFVDSQASAVRRHIIVGGPIVNSIAAGVTGLADRLTAAGDSVAEVDTATGNIIVAGYTAGDTGAAAQELINAIDGL